MIRKFIGIFVLAVLAVLGSSSVAKADGVDTFTLKTSGNTFTWKLPASPVITSGNAYSSYGFELDNVAVSENGGPATQGNMDFYSYLCAGGFDYTVNGNFLMNTAWTQLYKGTEENPTFLLGTFSLTDYASNDCPLPATLTIATPEPSAIVLLSLGLLALLLAFAAKNRTPSTIHV